MLVIPSKPRVEIINSDVGQLDGVLDAFETDGAHGLQMNGSRLKQSPEGASSQIKTRQLMTNKHYSGRVGLLRPRATCERETRA